MKGIVQYCKKCFEDPDKEINEMKEICHWSDTYAKQHICIGYYTPDEKRDYCNYHPNEKLCDSVLTIDEYLILNEVSVDYNFIQAMEDLKQNDIIEFNLKMSQFRNQVQQQKSIQNQQSEKSKAHCPHCNSTNIKPISGLNRGASIAMWGIFSKKINKSFECKDCGYTW